MNAEEVDRKIYLAKVAEQAERYDEMARHLSEVAQAGVEFDPERRNLLSVAYKNAVGSRRNALRVVTTLHAKESARGMVTRAEDLAKYRATIESELEATCSDILKSLDALLSAESIKNGEDVEGNVFYSKMKADYHRYIAEFATGEKRAQASESAKLAYESATETSVKLNPTHPIRLGLALNYSVFHYEIMEQPKLACEIAQKAYDAASNHNPSAIDSDSYQDTSLIAQLLRDNLMLWTQHNEELERQEAAAQAATKESADAPAPTAEESKESAEATSSEVTQEDTKADA